MSEQRVDDVDRGARSSDAAPRRRVRGRRARVVRPLLRTLGRWSRFDDIDAFLAEHGEIVVKPLHGNAGKAVFKVGRDGANLASLIELFNATYREPALSFMTPPNPGNLETLKKRGVTVVDALGADFDPHLHQAVAYEEVAGAREGEVVGVMAKGYKLGDRLLRPALVKVAKAS